MNPSLFPKKLVPLLLLSSLLTLLFAAGCKKDRFNTDPNYQLEFSVDTLTFDTVFTTLGSVTKGFKVYNRSRNKVKISSITLGGGEASNFRINVDGISGIMVEDIEINGKDSIYVFAEVTVDPGNQNNPLLIADSVRFVTNGNRQRVVLAAWGQDAHFYNGVAICDETWTNDKPYVILNSMQVDTGCVLTIEPGVTIYLNSASIFFVSGTIKINGTKDEPVEFRGLRLEDLYDDIPGQWQGILLLPESTDNEVNYAVVKNSVVGMRADQASGTGNPKLKVTNTVFKNIFGSAIIGVASTIQAENCLAYNCGEQSVQLELGGTYNFQHCTFSNYNTSYQEHQKGTVRLTVGITEIGQEPMNATFYNCIIDGTLDEEVEIEDYDDSGLTFNYLFDHCLLKTERDTNNSHFANILLNTDPSFTDRPEEDYSLASGSPCINTGKAGLSGNFTDTDLAGEMRDGSPDIGAYEFQ